MALQSDEKAWNCCDLYCDSRLERNFRRNLHFSERSYYFSLISHFSLLPNLPLTESESNVYYSSRALHKIELPPLSKGIKQQHRVGKHHGGDF